MNTIEFDDGILTGELRHDREDVAVKDFSRASIEIFFPEVSTSLCHSINQPHLIGA